MALDVQQAGETLEILKEGKEGGSGVRRRCWETGQEELGTSGGFALALPQAGEGCREGREGWVPYSRKLVM